MSLLVVFFRWLGDLYSLALLRGHAASPPFTCLTKASHYSTLPSTLRCQLPSSTPLIPSKNIVFSSTPSSSSYKVTSTKSCSELYSHQKCQARALPEAVTPCGSGSWQGPHLLCLTQVAWTNLIQTSLSYLTYDMRVIYTFLEELCQNCDITCKVPGRVFGRKSCLVIAPLNSGVIFS